MNRLLVYLILSSLILGCEIATTFDDMPNSIWTGSRSNAFVATPPDLVDSLYKDFTHLDSREMDLNNDAIFEFNIVSEEDSVFDEETNVFLFYRKRLTIIKNPVYEGRLSVVTDQDGNIKIFDISEEVNPENQQFQIINNEKYFCDFSIDANQQVINYGHWNDEFQRYFVVSTRVNEVDIAAWVKITVEKFDNYVYFGFASFYTNWATYNE